MLNNPENKPENKPTEPAHDGRYIDPALGSLTGEGSQQQVTSEDPYPEHTTRDVWRQNPVQAQQSDASPTYYERPVLKEPVWVWSIAVYFFVGGAAGAAGVLGAATQALGGRRLENLVKRCQWLAATGMIMSAFWLIYDLGRPKRFLNMLRVFRPTSPMSIGSWVLAAAGASTSAAAVLTGQRGIVRRIGNVAGYASSLPCALIAGYTAVLITNTVVPLWQAVRFSLPFLFISSAMASAGALLELFTLNPQEMKVVERFGAVGKIAELGLMFVVEREAAVVEQVGLPLRQGRSGNLWRASKLLNGLGLLTLLLPKRFRWRRLFGALTTCAGALCLRFAMIEAGHASTRDPRATFLQQRAGHGAAEVTGVAAVTGPDDARAFTAFSSPTID
ncbi:hypothetical protein BH10CHL1_BH10CHL1_41170 [soil metagenome]